MITAICRQPQCRRHWELTGLNLADTHRAAEEVIQHAACPECGMVLTDEQKSAYLQCFDEVLEMERPADVEYWFGYMMGGGPHGTH